MISNFKKITNLMALCTLLFTTSTTDLWATKSVTFSDDHIGSIGFAGALAAIYGFPTAANHLINFIKNRNSTDATPQETMKNIGNILLRIYFGFLGYSYFVEAFNERRFPLTPFLGKERYVFGTLFSLAGIATAYKAFKEGQWLWENRNEKTDETSLNIAQRLAKTVIAALFSANMLYVAQHIVKESIK